MTRAISRRIAGVLLGVGYVLAVLSPLRAQTLNVPVEAHIRPIQTATLFHEFFADFFPESDGTTYVQTGDIHAMWLRDSAAQTIPYVRFVPAYPGLRYTFFGVVQRDAKNVLVDPHAEAFTSDYHVWEDKWEIDSLAWPIALAFTYYANTHDRTIFTPVLHRAMRTIVSTLQCEQHHAACSRYSWPHPVPTHPKYNPDTGMMMHESVDPNDPSRFTRPEFGWANAFWADLLFRTVAGYRATPYLTIDTMVPLEQMSEIPTLTSLSTQLADTAELTFTFGSLLHTQFDP